MVLEPLLGLGALVGQLNKEEGLESLNRGANGLAGGRFSEEVDVHPQLGGIARGVLLLLLSPDSADLPVIIGQIPRIVRNELLAFVRLLTELHVLGDCV